MRLAVHVLRAVAVRAADEAADAARALREAPGDAAREIVGGVDVADEATHRVGGGDDVARGGAVEEGDAGRSALPGEAAAHGAAGRRDGTLGDAVREDRVRAVDVADEAALVVAVGSGDGDVRDAVRERGRGIDAADEAAGLGGGGDDGAGGGAVLERRAGAAHAADEEAGVGVRVGDDTLGGAVADRGPALHVADERAGVPAAAVHADALEVDVRERRVLDGTEEARVVRPGVDAEARDRVALAVERAGEGNGIVADGRPAAFDGGEVDVRGEGDVAREVVLEVGELRGGGDELGEARRDGAEVVEDDGRRGGVGVGVGHRAHPADEDGGGGFHGANRDGGAGRVPARAGDGAAARADGRAKEAHLAVRERPGEVGVRRAVDLRPDLRVERVVGGEVRARVHPGRIELGHAREGRRVAGGAGAGGVDAGELGAAVRDRAVLARVADEGAGVGAGAVEGARRVAAREDVAGVVNLAGETADGPQALGAADGVAVRAGHAVVAIAQEAARVRVGVRGRGGDVADGEAFGRGRAASAVVADEAARVFGRGHGTGGHTAQECVGGRDVAGEAAGLLARRGDGAEGAAIREAGAPFAGADEAAGVRAVAGHVALGGAAEEGRAGVVGDAADEAARVLPADHAHVRGAVGEGARAPQVADEATDRVVLGRGHAALGGAAREGGRAAALVERADEAAAGGVAGAARADDGRVRVAVDEGRRALEHDAHEAAGVPLDGGDGAGGRAVLEEDAGAGDASGEQPDVAVVAAHRALRGAVADRGGALDLARERAAAFVAVDGDAFEADAVDRRVLDVAEEADAASVGIAGRRVVEREAGDLVPAPVERAGERLRGGAERRPGRAGEVDVRAEAVVAGEGGGVVADGLQLGARGDERAERGRDGAVVVREDGRGGAARVGVGGAARPAEEDAARRVDGDRGVRSGGVRAETGDDGRVAAQEEAAVHEAPREVGLRLAVDLRPAARRAERGKAVRGAHPGGVEDRDARHRGRGGLREAVRENRRGGEIARETTRVRRT